MTMPQVTQTLYIDAVELAQALEFELGPYLLSGDDENFPGPNDDQAPGSRETPRWRLDRHPGPAPSARGLLMVGDMIAWVLNQHAHWKRPVGPDAPEIDVAGLYALPQHKRTEEPLPIWTPLRGYFQTSSDAAKDYRNNQEVLGRASDLLLDMRSDLQRFLGNDHWVMHFHHRCGNDYAVEKTIDFRIFDWERRMKDGEWKQS